MYRSCCVWILAIGVLIATDTESPPAELVIAVTVEKAILLLPGGPDRSVRTRLQATASGFPPEARITWSWSQIQDFMSPVAADMAQGRVVAIDHPASAAITATCTAFGVYALRVTATDQVTGRSVSRNTWLSVWDARSPLLRDGQPDPMTPAPGIAPPPQVRNLSPDPGPYRHPRLLCTAADWSDIHQRCLGGGSRIAANSFTIIAKRAGNLLKPATREGAIMAQLETWAAAGFPRDRIPTLGGAERNQAATKGEKRKQVLAEEALDATAKILAEACFVQWLKTDPATPRTEVPEQERVMNERLARLVAAFCRASLDVSWDRETGTFFPDRQGYLNGIEAIGEACPLRSPLALAYDFIAPWMTPEQAAATRDFLVATGVGRSTGSGRNVFARDGKAIGFGVDRGYAQNGNYATFHEGQVMKALVVAGEEEGVDPRVVATFLTPPPLKKPQEFTKTEPYDWIRPVAEDSGRDWYVGRPYAAAMSWPHARKVNANNLLRAVFWNQDGNVSPWGFILEREAYHSTSEGQWLTAVAFARYGAQNQFVTGYFYHIINHLLLNQYTFGPEQRGQTAASNVQTFHHHCGGYGIGKLHTILLKYMYPDDPAVDYFYAARAPDLEKKAVSMEVCIFGLDPALKTTAGAMAPMAAAKALPLTKVDPEEGVVVMRSGWEDDALMIDLDCGWKGCGHMNAEKNSFALFALGRSWALPSGYHKKFSNWHAGIQFQHPAWKACPVTQGYVGQNPSYPPTLPDAGYPRSFPTPPGRLVEVWDAPDHSWSYAVGDASLAYNFMCSTEGERLCIPRSQAMYPGLMDDLRTRLPIAKELFIDGINSTYRNRDLYLIPSPWTAVKRAVRTLVMVRGPRPYALIVDDFQRDDAPANYRWGFSNVSGTEDGKRSKEPGFLVDLLPGATSTEGILAHRTDLAKGGPRLLVRDLGQAVPGRHPPIRMDRTHFLPPTNEQGDFYLEERSNRLVIERVDVVDPQYQILLFPFREGEALPVTTWNAGRTVLSISLGTGVVDEVTFRVDPATGITKVHLTRPGP